MGKKRVTIEDVVKIKRLLLENKYNNKEVAELAGVSVRTVNRIKHNESYTNIKVDENGNHIKKEAKPEEFKVEYKENKKEEFKVDKNDFSYKYRQQFIDDYFEFRNLRIEAKNKYDRNYINKIFKNRGWLYNHEYDDFISQVSLIVTETVMKFQPDDEIFSWYDVDKESASRKILKTIIYKSVDKKLLDYENYLNHSYLDRKNNEYKKVVIGSTDERVGSDEKEALLNILSDEHNYFYLKDYDYESSPFLKFFKDNYENLLTEKQIEFMNVMKFYVDADSSYTPNYNQIVDKPFTQAVISHNKKRIKERIEKAYDEFLENNENV